MTPGQRNFLLFVAVSGFAAGVNVVARAAINRWTGYEVAIVIAYVTAMLTAFTLNRLFVFRPEAAAGWAGQLVRFGLVNLVALVQVFLVSLLLARLVFPAVGMAFHPDTVAHAIGVASPAFTSYWGHRYFTFGRRGGAGGSEVR